MRSTYAVGPRHVKRYCVGTSEPRQFPSKAPAIRVKPQAPFRPPCPPPVHAAGHATGHTAGPSNAAHQSLPPTTAASDALPSSKASPPACQETADNRILLALCKGIVLTPISRFSAGFVPVGIRLDSYLGYPRVQGFAGRALWLISHVPIRIKSVAELSLTARAAPRWTSPFNT